MKTKCLVIVLTIMLIPASLAWTWDNDWEHHKPKSDTYTVSADFWMEKFQGGGPGQQGNVLFAAGQGFIFQNALLKEIVNPTPPTYPTTYIGGELILDSTGPWGAKYGKLIATGITALNVATQKDAGALGYTLTFNGRFDNDCDLCFSVTAVYDGTPTVVFLDSLGIPLLQKGVGPAATITLTRCKKW
jgi:hypothetical protein